SCKPIAVVGAHSPIYNLETYLTRLSRMRSFAPKAADEVSKMSALQRCRSEVLRRMRITAGKDMRQLRPCLAANSKVLSGVRASNRLGYDHTVTIWAAGGLHAQAPRREDPQLQISARG